MSGEEAKPGGRKTGAASQPRELEGPPVALPAPPLRQKSPQTDAARQEAQAHSSPLPETPAQAPPLGGGASLRPRPISAAANRCRPAAPTFPKMCCAYLCWVFAAGHGASGLGIISWVGSVASWAGGRSLLSLTALWWSSDLSLCVPLRSSNFPRPCATISATVFAH